MKTKNQLILVLLLLSYHINLSFAQNQSKPTTDPFFDDSDAMVKEAVKAALEDFRLHELHIDNKDSAWINDFDGNIVWESRLKSKDGKSITLIDSLTGNYYTLDTSHRIITAYDKLENLNWKTDPHKDNSIRNYRNTNPKIKYFQLGELDENYDQFFKKGNKVIYITYNNSQFGLLDLATGKFIFLGQD